jgi:formamidopyrimidine-DNA glycosylase
VPELPDLTVYLEALEERVLRRRFEKLRLASPFILRTVSPTPIEAAVRQVLSLRLLGKRIVFELEEEIFIVVHLMIAGRLKWLARNAKVPKSSGQAALDFENGTVLLTEAGSKRRASIHLVRGEAALRAHDPGGADPLTISLEAFAEALGRERHTLKRTLTDPRTLSGIGNAYSDEILHRARLSPVQLSTNLDAGEIERLHAAMRDVLTEWTDRLRTEAGDQFPTKVTAFRPEMAVHGRFKEPCPVCGTPVQRIVYADNETNYCARCQTDGKLLADRALSRLLHSDWPKSIDDL